MRFYETSTQIGTDPQTVWAVLTDLEGYTSWDSGIVETTGTIGAGAKIAIRSAVDPGRTFRLRVTELEGPTTMRWTGGAPLRLFTGRRTFQLRPFGDGSTTEFHLREEFTGPLVPLIWRSMPDLQPSFDRFAAGLRARAEAARAS
ncbi:MAG: SRPBCC domain-containing protein [Actinomycetota bacterium]